MLKSSLNVLLLAMFLVVPGLAQEKATKIKFTKKNLKKGTVCNFAETKTQTMKQEVNIPDQGTQSTTGEEKKKSVIVFTVQEVSDKGAVTKAKVQFKKIEDSNKVSGPMGEQDNSKDSPLVGKTYMLSLSAGALGAKNEQGEDVSAEEMTALKDHFKTQIKEGTLYDPYMRVDKVLAGKEVAMGETIKLGKAEARALMGADGDEADGLKSVTLKLKAKKTVFGVECAVFDLKIDVDHEELAKMMQVPGATANTDFNGELIVAIDGLFGQNMKFKGPMTMEASQETPMGAVDINVNLQIDMNAIATYVMPK